MTQCIFLVLTTYNDIVELPYYIFVFLSILRLLLFIIILMHSCVLFYNYTQAQFHLTISRQNVNIKVAVLLILTEELCGLSLKR